MLIRNELFQPPPEVALSLPSLDILRRLLGEHVIEIAAGTQFVRMARYANNLWPVLPLPPARFGPPAEYPTGVYWMYCAKSIEVAAWESRTCVYSLLNPGTFRFAPHVAETLVATMTFSAPIRLYDLSGMAATQANITASLRSADYEWCRWFGVLMQDIIAESMGEIHGFLYPSRLCPGSSAIAICSESLGQLDFHRETKITEFIHTEEYRRLQAVPTFYRAER